jgi:hypothetical protein
MVKVNGLQREIFTDYFFHHLERSCDVQIGPKNEKQGRSAHHVIFQGDGKSADSKQVPFFRLFNT